MTGWPAVTLAFCLGGITGTILGALLFGPFLERKWKDHG